MNALFDDSGVYALVDPRSHKVMYVGQSLDVNKRFKQHTDIRHSDSNWGKAVWLSELRRSGLVPELIVLASNLDYEQMNEAEKRYIREYKVKGEAEFNIAAGGAGAAVSKAFNSRQDDWIALGNKVKTCHLLLVEIFADVQRIAGKKYCKPIHVTIRKLDSAKCGLDNLLARTFPEWREFTKVFYGPESPTRQDSEAHP